MIVSPVILLLALTITALSLWMTERVRTQQSGHMGIPHFAMVCFVLAYPVSAVCHMLRTTDRVRGYYDLRHAWTGEATSEGLVALILIFVALVAYGFGIGLSRTQSVRPTMETKQTLPVSLLAVAACVFLLLGVIGIAMLLRDEANPLQVLVTVDRSRSAVGGGKARFMFLSHWYTWGIIFAFLAASNYTGTIGRRVMMTISLLALPIPLYHLGGRAYVLLVALALVFCAHRVGIRASKSIVILAGASYISAILAITYFRDSLVSTTSPVGLVETVLGILDWQYGRYSTVVAGLGMEATLGEASMLLPFSGFLHALDGWLRLAQIESPFTLPKDVTEIATAYLTNRSRETYVVPGAICELYYAWGVIGVAGGAWLLGYLVRLISRGLEHARHVGSTCWLVYAGLVVALWGMPATFTGWCMILAVDGLPCLVLLALERRWARQPIRRSVIVRVNGTNRWAT